MRLASEHAENESARKARKRACGERIRAKGEQIQLCIML